MKTITTFDEMLDWAKRANESCSTKVRCDLQDEFGRSKSSDIDRILGEAVTKDTKRLIIFGLYKVMGDSWLETALSIWGKAIVEKHRKKLEDEINVYWGNLMIQERKLIDREKALRECRKPIYKMIKTLKDQSRLQVAKIDYLRSRVNDLQRRLSVALAHSTRNEEESLKFRSIQELLGGKS